MLNEMYEAVERFEHRESKTIDLVIVCGDCQTIRHFDDLKCLSIPNKYKKVGDFHEYYSGVKTIPKLTIFVGGNHEASNYLMTLPYGGWVCDNFYYLGYAGVVKYRGLRIAGASGIYNFRNCNKGRYERMPLDDQSIKSIYHTRRLDIFRLQLLSKNVDKNPIDVVITHDWPARIYDYGNKEQLLRFKPHFRSDVESRDGLGSPLTKPLIHQLKPSRWFAAHLHCRFYAKVAHDKSRSTEFLSLNKIENKRHFMEFLELTPSNEGAETDENDLYYDEEWLAILQKTYDLEKDSRNNVFCPKIDDEAGKAYYPSDEEIQKTVEMMNKSGGLKIPRNFKMIEPVIYNRPHGVQPSLDRERVRSYPNPQTEKLCFRVGLKTGNPSKMNTSDSPSDESEVIEIHSDEEVSVKVEPNISGIQPTAQLKSESACFRPVGIKIETKEEKTDPPPKKRALSPQDNSFGLDEDGCLPFYIDTRRDK